LLVREGHVAVSLDGTETGHDGPLAVIVPAGIVHGFRFREGTAGWVLTVSRDLAARGTQPDDPFSALIQQGALFGLGPVAARRVEWLAGEMLALQHEWRASGPLRRTLAEALVRAIAADIGDAASTDIATMVGTASTRLDRFRALVEQHFRAHHDLDFYAGALGLTRRTLSRLTAAKLGCTPAEVLHRRRAAEARRMLRYTSASAAQIAAELGFEDPSYFSRFYLRMTGKRPGEERGR
jgi:AraC family transcriptional activator of pobA